MSDPFYIVVEEKKNTYQVRKAGEDFASSDIYHVSYRPAADYWYCDCRGFAVQKDRSQHKHIRIVQQWLDDFDKGNYMFTIKKDGTIEAMLNPCLEE